MRRIWVALLALLSAATPAVSREVGVRSGEHGDFTRLVFSVPPGTDWQIKPEANGARLSVELDDVTFATGQVFGRLSDGRLRSLTQSEPGTELLIDFACECTATAFLHAGRMIVVDIAPRNDPAQAIKFPLIRPVQRRLGPGKDVADGASLDLPAIVDANPKLPLRVPLTSEAVEQQLLAQMLRGADQREVDLKLAPIGPRRTAQGQAETAGLRDMVLENISVGTVIDRDLAGVEIFSSLAEARPTCMADQELEFADWTNGTPFVDQVAQARTGLFGEFDRLDGDRALALARTYSYFGFGAEALQMLRLVAPRSNEGSVIRAIALVVEGEGPAEDNPFAGMQHCQGDAALWATLSERRTDGADSEAIELAFGRLPGHLRGLIGPALADILTGAAHFEAARRVLRAAQRSGAERAAEMALAQAEIASSTGDARTEVEALTDVVSSPDAAAEAPLALARLIERRWLDRQTVTDAELNLLAAYATEFRRSALGPELALKHVLALALNQQFDRSLTELQAQTNAVPEPVRRRTLDRLVLLLAERADDITFLKHVIGRAPSLGPALSDETTAAVSERVLALGFDADAIRYAEGLADASFAQSRTLLLAQGALAAGHPQLALQELGNSGTERARLLRAMAMANGGDFTGAADELKLADEPAQAERYLWLSDRWVDADPAEAGRFAKLSRLSLDLARPAQRLPDRPLADAAQLLQDSENARAMVTELLRAVQ